MDKKDLYKIKVNQFEFDISSTDLAAADLVEKGDGRFNVIKNSRSVNAVIIDANSKYYTVEVNGEKYEVAIKDDLDQMLDRLGFKAVKTSIQKEIKAPMPGLVLSIDVSEGQEVEEGARLLILEAMKMENSITLHAPAKIKAIKVKPGQPVEKGQVLMELE